MTQKPTSKRTLADGRYEIIKRLGAGGMGEVFLATDRNLDSSVVIKIPHASMLRDAEFAARFQMEIRSLVRLRHRSIVSIMDVGEENGVPFAVMQYLVGGSLEDRLRSGPKSEGTLQQWLPDVASALDFIHREGFVHRDIKPANILFDREGNAYVSDFGVAKVIDKGAAKQKAVATMTGTGMVIGTPDYMAPELVIGERFDHRVDQYALAVTVYEVLSGRRPFEGATPAAVMVKHSTMPAPSLQTGCPSASLHAVSAVERALSKLASSRYDSCTQFCSAVLNQSQTATPSAGSSVRSSVTSAVKSLGLSCPSCGMTMRLGEQHTGKTIRCSGCQAILKVADDMSRLTKTIVSSGASPSKASTALSGRASTTQHTGRRHNLGVPQSRATAHNASWPRWLVPVMAASFVVAVVLAGGSYFSGNDRIGIESQSDAAVVVQPTGEVPPTVSIPLPLPGSTTPVSATRVLPFAPYSIDEETILSVSVGIEGSRGGHERYRLALGEPEGMQVDPISGLITWRPSEIQGPGEFLAILELVDSDSRLISSQPLSINVKEVNKAPYFQHVEFQEVAAGETLEFQLSARDPDYPQNELLYQFMDTPRPEWQLDKATGLFRWPIPPFQPVGL